MREVGVCPHTKGMVEVEQISPAVDGIGAEPAPAGVDRKLCMQEPNDTIHRRLSVSVSRACVVGCAFRDEDDRQPYGIRELPLVRDGIMRQAILSIVCKTFAEQIFERVA